MNYFVRFKSLPVPTRKLLGLGIVLALLFGLPLFVWAIVSQKFLFSQKASTNTVPLNIQESFTGNGPIDATKWGWSGSNGVGVVLENDKLRVDVPAGSDQAGGNNASVIAYVNSTIPTITGPFDVSVDLVSIDSASGSAGIKFGAYTAGIFRTKIGSSEKIETRTGSTPSGRLDNIVASFDLPTNTDFVRVRIVRTDTEIQTYYNIGSGYILSAAITDAPQLLENGMLPNLVTVNLGLTFPSTTAFFDNYSATANTIVPATPSPIPTATAVVYPSTSPTPSPSPSPYVPIYQSFTVRVRFAGVNNEGADGAKITLRFENPSRFFDYTTSPFGLEYIGNGIYQAVLMFGSAVPPLPADNHYAIYAKGEKHLASKFCQQTGQTVRCTGVGNIIIPPATSNPASYVLDFSGLPLEPGDLSPQDGVANTNDFAKITALLIKPHSALTFQDLMVGDLNYDGYVNILDAFLIRQTLQTRYDEN